MPNNKASFPKELLNEFIEENNQNWINEYKTETNLDKGYYQALENFFKFKKYEKKPFNLFTTTDVSDYIEIMIDNSYSENRIDAIISNISSFKKFVVEKHPEIFSAYHLKDLPNLKIGNPEKKYKDSQSLNLVQLNHIKEFIKSDIRTEYIFEIFYQLNIQKRDIEVCSPKYADQQYKSFKKRDKVIRYNDKIQELLTKIEKYPKFKATYTMVNYHFNKIEQYLKAKGVYDLDRKLNYLDISKTHESYFLKCPNCGSEYENISVNWVLAKVDFCDDFYIVCSKCKGEPVNEYNKD